MADKLMIIDGNSIMNRAFYGLQGAQLLSTGDGLYTNAIFGFINILFKFLDEEKPKYICVAFDLKAPTFRHIEYEGYKAHRKGMPQELRVQVPVLKEVIDAMNIKRLEIEGYEADDIIGTIAKRYENETEVVIVTGDKDSFQLISDKIRVKIPTTRAGKTETHDYTLSKFTETYGITPLQFIDVKGVMGDPSDNIPGIPGVGEKTALDLVKKYGSVENILDNAEELEVRKNVKENILNNKELAVLSKRLATIDLKVPVDTSIEQLKLIEFDNDKLYHLFKRLEFSSLINKLGLKGQAQNMNIDVSVNVINDSDISGIVEEISKSKKMIYCIEYEHGGKSTSLGIAVSNGSDIYFLEGEDGVKKFKQAFEDESISVIGHDLKQDIVYLHSIGINLVNPYFDTMIAGYILNPSRETYNLYQMSQEYIGTIIPSDEEFFGKGKTLREINIQELQTHIGTKVDCINKLVSELENRIAQNSQEKLFYETEMPLVEVLASMEILGFMIDDTQLRELASELNQKIDILMTEIYSLAGEEFNINSPKQLGVILFDKLKLPVIKKNKTGYSTDAEVLEILAAQHEIVAKLLEYRQLIKLKTTYADGLLNVINPTDNKIHSNFKQTVTQTGRISSTEPNLQNIPIKLEMGRKFRKAFIPSSADYTLVDADYSQIELRVLAHIAEDKTMITAFINGEDIHTKTASEVFDVLPIEVTPLMRSRAKAVNFGIVYGISDYGLSRDLGISKKEAKEYIENYLENFTGVKKYMHEIVEYGKIKGYVTTLLNRIRYIPELKSSNFNVRSFGERVAMNTPIQGTAADIIKIAMVSVYKELKRLNLKSRLILQVHDELVVEAHRDEVEIVKKILNDKMTNALKLNVPLTIDIHSGDNWYLAK